MSVRCHVPFEATFAGTPRPHPGTQPRMTDRADDTASDKEALEAVLALLEDEHARAILTTTSVDPMSAKELSEHCDVSQATVYRRVERLTAAGLLAERTRPRADGHHDTVYVPRLDELSVRLRDGSLEFDLATRGEDIADRLTRLWEGF